MYRKWWQLAKASFIASIQYRAEIIIWMFLDFIPPLVLLAIWQAVFANKSEINGVTFNDMISYYVIVFVINSICAAHFGEWRSREIREGKIDLFLVKPVSYLADVFFRHTGGKLFYYLFATTPFLLLSIVALRASEAQTSLTVEQLLSFTFLLCIGYLIHFFISYCVVLSAFWLEQADSMSHFTGIVVTVFSGMMIPVALMPQWLAGIVNTLPFKYLYAVPLAVLQQNYSLKSGDFVYMLTTVAALFALSQVFWNSSRKAYGSAGG